MSCKILLLDIETAPIDAFVWGIWKENIPTARINNEWYMLTWAAGWLDSDETIGDSIHHYGLEENSDKHILESLLPLLDEADVVVAHNADRFDIPKINTRLIYHGMEPPSPYRQIDTLKEAKKSFKFTSNRLDYLGEFLGVGRKVEHSGFDLWRRCCAGDPEAFEEMLEYNRGDITLLESVYKRLRPWMKNHPNVGVYSDEEEPVCPKCGGSHLQWRGYATTQVSRYRRFQCKTCGGWGRARTTYLPIAKRKSLVTNVS